MRLKKWYAIQTYAGSELKVKDDLNDRIRKRAWERAVESFKVEGEETFFLVPVEEVITSRSRRGSATEYRIPYDYDLVAKPNERIQRGDPLARKPERHIEEPAKITDVELLQRVIIELTNRNEETYLVPADKHVRRDIRVGEKIRNGVPLTTDSDERFVIANRGTVVLRDKVRRVTFEHPDGKEKKRLISEKYVARIRNGMSLDAGDKIEGEEVIPSRASGLLKVKEYKDKRVVTIQRIEKRRLFPGYVFGRLGLEDEQMMELIEGIKGAVRYVGSKFKPMPIEGPEMKLIKRKAGLLAVPTAATAAAAAATGEPKIEIDFTVGEVVEIVEGPFADFTGEIKEIDKDAEEITVMVKIFGRETPVRLGFEGIEKL
ncbi:MAG: transcription termination/antitermination NusG family protein [Candidatus Bipolaricaulis sp.]|nr:transcription termination/antitermination NusG family protein [Candidatus Bipolaricaulis sp.]MDD5646016.1 transcription termination/antitermination NusG family protein [Candidatus Bipolaricaulis sp.]